MNCYKCGAELSEKSFCTSCGTDVEVYKKIIQLSNASYNDGLAKAKVRDLSGAILSLNRCLKYNKEHIQARNLLGLVYFEIGETVSALSQWIISSNIKQKHNIAQDYITTLQSNQGQLDAINQTIRKYNLALGYARQGSDDLAVIQLKKLLSVNSHLVLGHQLLALLLMKQKEYGKAYAQLKKAIRIDSSNTTTLQYMREIRSVDEAYQAKKKSASSEGIKILKKSKDKIEYKNGNEMIIQPTNIKQNNGLWEVINILIGLVVGAALMWFLASPAKIQVIKDDFKKKENANYEQLQAKKAEIDSLNKQIATLNGQVESVNSSLASYTGEGGQITNLEKLAEAERIYISGNISDAFSQLVTIDRNALSETAAQSWKLVYDNSISTILEEAQRLYESQSKSADSIALYQKILTADPANEEALYHCANAYRKNNQKDEAIAMFSTSLQTYPNGKYAAKAQNYVNELQNQQ